jgi:prepilin-type N-terminal cleavage/methylation domain-containing protein
MKKYNCRRSAQGGFTLVEIAIVLVIIGLLLGGILKGQEMITQAKIKNVITDMNGVAAAMYGYQDRYRALPGDDRNAGVPIGGGAPVGRWADSTSGNGDGVIQGAYNVAAPADLTTGTAITESVMFWHHLRKAGFVSGAGAAQPFNAVNGIMGVQTGDGTLTSPQPGILATAAGVNPFTGIALCTVNLPDKIAISVDAQLDDGVGTTGAVRGQLLAAAGSPALAAVATAAGYAETGNNTYVVCKSPL